MKFDFGENLKQLRMTKGLTQEQVAELLNVSKQSVSRWENNVTYPDITFLPILASFYCITVDSLLGVDYETNKRVLEEYLQKRSEAHQKGDVQGAFELSQEMYAVFPNDKSVIDNIMVDSYLMGFRNIHGKKEHYLKMSVSISERFLKMTEDMEEQCRCIKNIATCHKLLGNQEEAVMWTKRLPSIWSGIEGTSLGVLEGQEKLASIQKSLEAVLHLIHRLLYVYAETAEITPDEKVQILEKIPGIFEVLFENGDFGYYNKFLSRVYEEIAKSDTIAQDKSKEALRKAALYAKAYDELSASEHTSLLFKRVKKIVKLLE